MMLQIDTSLLTKEEMDLLQSLVGASTKILTKETKTKVVKSSLQPYKLEVVTYCTTCGLTHIQYFIMEELSDGSGLKSRKPLYATENEFGDLPVKAEYKTTRYCPYCERALSCLSVEELLAKLLKEVRRIYL